ncbi:MAG: GDYXXLXY domain-containing protein [Phycisphaerae bacterium]|jgi:uncharacterized membrane-anchored protein
MRKWLIIIVAALQVAVLAQMAGQRELVVRNGKTIYLRTAPVDPRDLFRGDYVSLVYEISSVPKSLLRGGLAENKCKQGMRVYAVLDANQDNLCQLLYVTDKKPREGLFIRGRVGREYVESSSIRVLYGIEAYFTQQGKGKQLERGRRQEEIQIPLEMELKLGTNGIAVLRGHRYSPLGIDIETEHKLSERGRQPITGIKVKMLNASDKPLAIVDLPHGRAFVLEPDSTEFRTNNWEWVNKDAAQKQIENGDLKILQPGEIYETHIDINDSYWFVKSGDQTPRTISGLGNWNDSFRLVYRPAPKEACAHLEKAELIWHGYLSSRTFTGLSW